MNLNNIREALRERTPGIIEVERASSVLIPLVEKTDGLYMLFEKRANGIRQGGEVCFPGGRIDRGETPAQTALRETEEELGLPQSCIELLGAFDTLHNYTDVTIHTYIGRIEESALSQLNIQEDEVEQVFLVPVRFFMENPPYVYRFDVVPDIREDFPYDMVVDAPQKYDWLKGKCNVPIWNYEGFTIWGLTARMIVWFLKVFDG